MIFAAEITSIIKIAGLVGQGEFKSRRKFNIEIFAIIWARLFLVNKMLHFATISTTFDIQKNSYHSIKCAARKQPHHKIPHENHKLNK